MLCLMYARSYICVGQIVYINSNLKVYEDMFVYFRFFINENSVVDYLIHVNPVRWVYVNAVGIKSNGIHVADDIFKYIFVDESVSISVNI